MLPLAGWKAPLPPGALLADDAAHVMLLAMSHGAILCDAAGRVTACNPAAARLLQTTEQALIGSHPSHASWAACTVEGVPLDAEEHPILVSLQTGVPLEGVVLGMPTPGGRHRWLAFDTRPLPAAPAPAPASTSALSPAAAPAPAAAFAIASPDATSPAALPALAGVVCTVRDVTTWRQEREELERQASVARRTDDAVIITDGDGRIEWVNQAMLALTGHTLDALVGRRPGEVLQGPETDPDTIAEMGAALARGAGWHGEVLNYRANGSAFWLELSISPAHDVTGRVTHYVSIAHDVSARRAEARTLFHLSAAVAASVDGVAILDSFQDFRFVNDAFARMLGLEMGERLVGTSWRSLYDRETVQRFDREIVHHLYLHDRWQGEVTARRRDGSTFPQELSATMLPGGGIVMVVRDNSDRRTAEAEQARLTAILEATPDLIAIATVDGDIPYLNAAGRRMLDLTADVRPTLGAMFPEWALQEVQRVGIPFAVEHGAWNGETSLLGRDGREIPVSQVIIAHKNARGEVEHLSTIMRDISERKEAEEALRRMSLCDPLTGLYNRRGFFMLAQQHLNVARTAPGHAILVYIDLNDFKAINDTFGHATGDAALREAADILGETFRDSDLCGRLGGDEFVALAVNCLDPTGDVLLRRLDERLAEHNARPDRSFALSMARGLVRFDPDDPKNLQQMLDQADVRLYEDKRARKGVR